MCNLRFYSLVTLVTHSPPPSPSATPSQLQPLLFLSVSISVTLLRVADRSEVACHPAPLLPHPARPPPHRTIRRGRRTPLPSSHSTVCPCSLLIRAKCIDRRGRTSSRRQVGVRQEERDDVEAVTGRGANSDKWILL